MRKNKTASSRNGKSAEAAFCCKGQAARSLQAGGVGPVGTACAGVQRGPACTRMGGAGGSSAGTSQMGLLPISSIWSKGRPVLSSWC